VPTYPRRWFAFRLRTLLLVVTAIAAIIGFFPEFEQRFLLVQNGWTMWQVRLWLGTPKATSTMVDRDGNRITELAYSMGGKGYAVHFMRGQLAPDSTSKVIGKVKR
jgi:hypothetical protein